MNQGALIAQIDLDTSTMKPYEGFIFLCGGTMSDINDPVASVRDGLLKDVALMGDLEPRIQVAETFKDWFLDSHYRDLVLFERHLAELSSVIVLILESAGSIAELGLFTAIEAFHEKLLVVVETSYYEHDSFIRRGLVDYLEKTKNLETECYNWRSPANRSFDAIIAQEAIQDLSETIRQRASERQPERPFSREVWRDKALLVCDLLGLFSALTIHELQNALSSVGCAISEVELRQMLFILEKVRMVAMVKRSSQRFYVGMSEQQHILLRFKDGGFDPARFRVRQLEHYEQEEKRRFRAIQYARDKAR